MDTKEEIVLPYLKNASLPLLLQIDGKRRVHFNAFMQDVHARIHDVKKHVVRDHTSTKPQPFDPIRPVARSISNQSWLICFDEFQVSNLTNKFVY